MERSAIILAGGFSSRLGQEKGLINLAGKPLIKHLLDRIERVVDEKLVIVSSSSQRERYFKIAGSEAKILVDISEMHNPLIGVATGLDAACGGYSVLLPCDTPFVSKEILQLLFDLGVNKNAAIPRWPNCLPEPLQAVYRTKPALDAARIALSKGRSRIQALVENLQGIRYVSTLVLKQLDPDLRTFFNVNTSLDLKKAENMLRQL